MHRDARTLDTLRPVYADASFATSHPHLHAQHAQPQEASSSRLGWILAATALLVFVAAGGAAVKLHPGMIRGGTAAAGMAPQQATGLPAAKPATAAAAAPKVVPAAGAAGTAITPVAVADSSATEDTNGTATSRRKLKTRKPKHAAGGATTPTTDTTTDSGSDDEAPPKKLTPPPKVAPPDAVETKKATDTLLKALAERPIGG